MASRVTMAENEATSIIRNTSSDEARAIACQALALLAVADQIGELAGYLDKVHPDMLHVRATLGNFADEPQFAVEIVGKDQ